VGSGGKAAGACWISGTQISPSCEAGHNEKMGLEMGGNWCCGVGEEMDQDWGGGGGRWLRNLAIRRPAVSYTLRPVIAVLILELDPYEGLYDSCFLSL